MNKEQFTSLIQSQHKFFFSGSTKNIQFRINQLEKLKKVLIEHQQNFYDAIYKDFKKSHYDTYTTELGLLYSDIDLAIAKVRKWSKKKRVKTNLLNFPARSYIYPEPLGTVLVIGAWNYPYILSIGPAVGAIAAGNTVIIKPSEIPTETSKAMCKAINENFSKDFLHVVEGGVEETTALLALKWDKIFFTGSPHIGKIVYQAAAKNLTPVTLELGGKSPAFITKGANLKVAAKRIVWGKFLNAGQTCIAPDYLLVDESIEEELLGLLKERVQEMNYSIEKANYPQIINEKNYQRLHTLVDEDKIYYAADNIKEARCFPPTILRNVEYTDKVMEEEIFGPILPVIRYKSLSSAINKVKKGAKPLSCYVFTNDKTKRDTVLEEISFGGGAINDTAMQFSNPSLPFGGVGNSGMGSYHGKAGFDTFTHRKSVLKKATWLDPSIRYTPYSPKRLKLISWMFNR